MSVQSAEPDGELVFPLVWRARIIAETAANVRVRLNGVLRAHGFECEVAEGRSSRGGRYETFRVCLTVSSQDALDSLGASIEALEGVRMVL